jgi:hypothetical protein
MTEDERNLRQLEHRKKMMLLRAERFKADADEIDVQISATAEKINKDKEKLK